jgi:hypothetical protein
MSDLAFLVLVGAPGTLGEREGVASVVPGTLGKGPDALVNRDQYLDPRSS